MQKTEALYKAWSEEKLQLELKSTKYKKLVKGEIWIVKVGVNLGSEISKDANFCRPALVLQPKCGGDLCLVAFFTTSYSEQISDYLYEIEKFSRIGLSKKSYILLNSIKTISRKRLIYKINNEKRKGKYFYKVSGTIIGEVLERFIKIAKK